MFITDNTDVFSSFLNVGCLSYLENVVCEFRPNVTQEWANIRTQEYTRIRIKNENWKQIERLSTHIWIQTKWDAVFGEVKLDNRSLSVLSLLTSYFKKTFNMCLLQYRNFLEGKYNFLIWVLEPLAKWIALVRSGCSGALLVFFNWEIIGQNVEINVKQYVRVSFLI